MIHVPNLKRVKTKKEIHRLGLHLLRLFKKMDWIHYYEKKDNTSNNSLIHKLIYFKYKNYFQIEYALTKEEYQYWRSIKPKMR